MKYEINRAMTENKALKIIQRASVYIYIYKVTIRFNKRCKIFEKIFSLSLRILNEHLGGWIIIITSVRYITIAVIIESFSKEWIITGDVRSVGSKGQLYKKRKALALARESRREWQKHEGKQKEKRAEINNFEMPEAFIIFWPAKINTSSRPG
jgi:hypothetical protein